MPKYIFILGRSPKLSLAEIFSLLAPDTQTTINGANFVLTNSQEAPEQLISSLGGTIKIAKFLKNIDTLDQLDSAWWQSVLPQTTGKKINFGFSLYNDAPANFRKIKNLALAVKKNISFSSSARLVTGRQADLSSVIVAKNKLIGSELIIIKHQTKYILGITEAVQDFGRYGQRDIGRPERDDESGMLPPKLAKIMINLAGPGRDKTLLDPFCGSGTILQEAALLGFNNIYGTDLSSSAISASQKNLSWLNKQFKLKVQYQLKQASVEKLSQAVPPRSIDLIVTEPFMGPARQIQSADPKTLAKISQDLRKLYLTAFAEFKKILAPGGQIIFIFPIFKSAAQAIASLPKQEIKKMGFRPRLLPPNNEPLIYSRPDQKVQRQITAWTL